LLVEGNLTPAATSAWVSTAAIRALSSGPAPNSGAEPLPAKRRRNSSGGTSSVSGERRPTSRPRSRRPPCARRM
jgi:hypothetical protein